MCVNSMCVCVCVCLDCVCGIYECVCVVLCVFAFDMSGVCFWCDMCVVV